MHRPLRQSQLAKLIRCDVGTIISFELVLLATTALFGLLVGLVSVRDAMVSELSDVAGSVQDLNQSQTIAGITGPSARTSGFDFLDATDIGDDAEDVSGLADNFIVFNAAPIDEMETPAFILSAPGSLLIDSVTTGVGGAVLGTIGDGTINAGFTVTTDTGNFAGQTGPDQVRFRDTPTFPGVFTISYTEPLTEFEFWIRDLGNAAGQPENLFGNFTLTLSDGSIFNNAAFSILPDVIAPNRSFGLFSTRGNDRSSVVSVNRGGFDYLTDATFNGTSDQSAGRLTFNDVPAFGADGVGVSSLSFERSGGSNGFQATFSTSGRVISLAP